MIGRAGGLKRPDGNKYLIASCHKETERENALEQRNNGSELDASYHIHVLHRLLLTHFNLFKG